MAVAYLTGQRRVAGQGFLGRGPFLERRSRSPATRFSASHVRRTNLRDFRVSAVRGKRRASSAFRARRRRHGSRRPDVPTLRKKLMRLLGRRTTAAGDVRFGLTAVTARRSAARAHVDDGSARLFATPEISSFPTKKSSLRPRSGHTLRGWFIPPPERSDGRTRHFRARRELFSVPSARERCEVLAPAGATAY